MSNAFLDHHNSWKANHDQGGGYGFPMLKVKVGIMQFRVLDEKPVSRVFHYRNNGGRPVICSEDECLFCLRGYKPTTQHFLNIVDRSDDKVKVLAYSAAAATAIADLIEEVAKSEDPARSKNSHPTKYDIELTRTGTTREDTRYKAVSVEKKFSPDAYTPHEIVSKLTPLTVEEQKKLFGSDDSPTDSLSSRGTETFKGEPPSAVVVTPKVETVIKDDDKETI